MNWLYDTDGAVSWLNSYLARVEQEGSEMPSLRCIQLTNCRVERFDGPPTLRLVRQDGDNLEEVTCRVPGLLCSKVLPPVRGPLRSTDYGHVRLLRQHVRLTGRGSPEFDESALRMAEIEAMFKDAVVTSGQEFDGISAAQYEGDFAIDAHTRYLTERRLVHGQRHIPFTPEVDPNHALEAARDIHFIRTLDNVVEYRERRDGPDGRPRYEPLAPECFREGDIVEASVTFIAHPLGRGAAGNVGYKLVPTLRGLTLLNAEFRERSRPVREVEVKESRSDRRKARKQALSTNCLQRKYVAFTM